MLVHLKFHTICYGRISEDVSRATALVSERSRMCIKEEVHVMKLQNAGFFLFGFAVKWIMEAVCNTYAALPLHVYNLREQQLPPKDQQKASDPLRNNLGWREIHKFVGTQSNLDEIGNAVGYSQVGQDEVILNLLQNKQRGYFVDLAANHAVVLSNTYKLEAWHGWHGICIEPNPAYEWGLLQRNCTYVAAIIGANRMEKVSVVLPPGQAGPGGGIVRDDFDNKKTIDEDAPSAVKKRARTTKPTTMYTVSLTEILDRFAAPQVIDYVSLDVEGAEFYVMQSFDFDRYKIRVMTVERPNQQLVDLFYEKGYVYLAAFNKYGDETLFALKSELPDLNQTVVDTTLHKASHRLMEVPQHSLSKKPRVFEQRAG